MPWTATFRPLNGRYIPALEHTDGRAIVRRRVKRDTPEQATQEAQAFLDRLTASKGENIPGPVAISAPGLI